MNPKNGNVGQSWVWGGSLAGLMLAAVTRQAAFGVLPMAVVMPLWQRQHIQQMQAQSQQHQSRWQQQFQSFQQDYLTSLTKVAPQPGQDGQAALQGLRNQIQDLQAHQAQTHTQVAQVKDHQGSLHTQVQQLRAHLGDIQGQVKDSQGSLHSQVAQMQQIQAQWDQMRVAMTLDTSATKQLTAMRQQLSCVLRDLRVLHLSQGQDRSLRHDVDQLRQDLDRVVSALAKQPPRQPMGVFIDGANIHHSARDRGVKLDYPQLVNHLVNQVVGTDAVQPDVVFYSGYDPHNFAHLRFKQDLRAAGFRTKMQPVTHRADGSSKANMDGQMIVDMLLGHYDRVLLLSGDGDFLPALTALQQMKTQVTVAAFGQDTHRDLKSFPFVDLAKVLQPGGQVVDLPQKQVPPQRQA